MTAREPGSPSIEDLMMIAASSPIFVRHLAALLFVSSVSVGVASGCSASAPSSAVGPAPADTALVIAPGATSDAVVRIDPVGPPALSATPPEPHSVVPQPRRALPVPEGPARAEIDLDGPEEEGGIVGGVPGGVVGGVPGGVVGGVPGPTASSQAKKPQLIASSAKCDFPKDVPDPTIDRALLRVTILVDATGNATSPKIVSQSAPGFVNAAIECARKLKFTPGTDDAGKPSAQNQIVTLAFQR